MKSIDAGIFFDQMIDDLNNGNLSRKSEMVEFFKKYNTNPNPTKTNIMQTWLNYVLTDACKNGHLNVVDFVLTSEELPLRAEINFNKDLALFNACENNHLDIVKFLLTSTKLQEHGNIHARNQSILTYPCKNGCLEIIKYLTSSPDLKEHADIHANNDEPFMNLAYNNHLEVIKYFIFDLKMQKTSNIIHIASQVYHIDLEEQLDQWVKVRDFKELVQDLPTNESKTSNKLKV
jgi:hypothetical protein